MKDFDFDDWADLYKRDPQAFEARRQAVLAIELAKGGAAAIPARQVLRQLEADLEGCTSEERMLKSFEAMAASMGRLQDGMSDLGSSVADLNSALERVRALRREHATR